MSEWRIFPKKKEPIDQLEADLPKMIAIIGNASNVIQARRDKNKDALERALDSLERSIEEWLPG